MTQQNQDFTVYAGDYTVPIVSVTDGNGNALDISAAPDIIWSAQRDIQSASVITKKLSTGGIAKLQTQGEFSITLLPTDTQNLTGFYMHKVVILDDAGEPSTITLGRMQVGLAPAWSYSGDPANSNRDALRATIGDTDSLNQLFSDPQLDWLLGQYPSVLFAAAQACRLLAQRYAAKVSKRVGDLSINYSDLANQYLKMATTLQSEAEQTGTLIYAGGISKSDMAANRENCDRNPCPFRMDQFDDRGAIGGIAPDNVWP